MPDTRSRRPLLVLAGTLIVMLLTAAMLTPAGHASSGKSCSQPRYPGSGYFTSIKVSHTDCTTGRKVTLDYYHCRTKHGRKGWCHARVDRFSCSEKRPASQRSRFQYIATVTCNRGRARVVTVYSQNL
jgi:hypothetical protein